MFSKKPAERSRLVAASPVAASPTFSVIGADVTIKGDIHASADLHVDGRIEGDLSCASLVQGEAGLILGAIVAESARLAGEVRGSIKARELVILRSARVEGDVEYDALTIEQGAEVVGRFAPQRAAATAPIPADVTEQVETAQAPAGDDDEPRLSLAG
jgi:cytoskeletal protein CcmA (bactofilin family)